LSAFDAICVSSLIILRLPDMLAMILFIGDEFAVIQKEILMLRDCRHENIVAYLGSYL